jgi:hypothetical protein
MRSHKPRRDSHTLRHKRHTVTVMRAISLRYSHDGAGYDVSTRVRMRSHRNRTYGHMPTPASIVTCAVLATCTGIVKNCANGDEPVF